MADCENCLQVKAIEKDIKRLEKYSDDYEERISGLESAKLVSEERFKQVFEKLDAIILILKEKKGRLPTLMWTVGGMVLGGTLVGVIMWIFEKIAT